jgi:hypothetical protein
MIGVRIDSDSLDVQATGRDWWPYYTRWRRPGTRLSVRLPLAHITGARTARPRKRMNLLHLDVPAGGKRNRNGTFIWCRPGVPVLELDMDGQPYRHVMLSVPDAEPLAEQIRSAAGVGTREP